MRRTQPVRSPHRTSRIAQIMLAALLLGVVVLASACGGSTQSQNGASSTKGKLDQLLQHAQQIGVPATVIQPVQKQEQQLSSTSAPFSPFNEQQDTDYYNNLSKRYNQLYVQLQGLISTTTAQFQAHAQDDMHAFQQALSLRQSQKIGNLSSFNAQYSNDQALLTKAQLPKDYAAVSQNAQQEAKALGLMGLASERLTAFENAINQMQASQLDVIAVQAQYQADMKTFNNATTSAEFSHLYALINSQYQQAVVKSIETIPYVGAAKLHEFQSQLNELKTYGVNTDSYQKLYDTDKTAMGNAKTIQEYEAFSKQVDNDMATIHSALVQGAANYLVNKLNNDANTWGNAHQYHDSYNGQNYILDSGYTLNGIGWWIQQDISWAQTPQDYQSIVDFENNEFFNMQMMEQNYNDKTPYNQPHATDLELINHYHLTGQVIVVSLTDEALRLYQNGKLVRAFYVTTGQPALPSLPGNWSVVSRLSPTVFKSSDPPSSPYWYPPTNINYAIGYHEDGYFLHDAWWRVNFGPGTEFPHYDVGGDESFAGQGSHGCINMPEDQAAWMYANTNWNTSIVVY
jgi:lipoprotein-anchoring transpeptidase ErfK/SrfK